MVLAIGAILPGFAHHASDAPIDRLSKTLTGRYTTQTTWYFVTGALMALCGHRTRLSLIAVEANPHSIGAQ